MTQIITRKEAKRLRLNKYYTGKPCKNNHICERYVQSGTCERCINGDRVSYGTKPQAASVESVRHMMYEFRFRLYPQSLESFRLYVFGVSILRDHRVIFDDVVINKVPSNLTNGAGMYAIRCFAEDLEELQKAANTMLFGQPGNERSRMIIDEGRRRLAVADSAYDDSTPPINFK